MMCCSWILNPIGPLKNITKISTISFVITGRMFHICIYLLVVIIITFLGLFLQCTITPFVETDVLSLFAVIFRWFLAFINKMINRSVSFKKLRLAFISLSVQITSYAIFFLIFSYPKKKNLCWEFWYLHKKFIFS